MKDKNEKRIAALEAEIKDTRRGITEFAQMMGREAAEVTARLDHIDAFNELQLEINETQSDINDAQRETNELVEEDFNDLEEASQEFAATCGEYDGANAARLQEVCDFLGLERLPMWKWNIHTNEFETGFMLRYAPPSLPPAAQPFTSFQRTIHIPSVFVPQEKSFSERMREVR